MLPFEWKKTVLSATRCRRFRKVILKLLPALASFVLYGTFAFAQGPTATISGIVSEPRGLVGDAPVQIKHVETGAVFRAMSASDGSYNFAGLQNGLYDVSVTFPGFAYKPFSGKVTVASGKSAVLEIKLEIGNVGTLGDDPATGLAGERRKLRDLSGPVPRTPAGIPDLSGVWFGNDDLYPEDPSALPWAARIARERLAAEFKDGPYGMCLPFHSINSSGPFFRKFIQTTDLLVILTEDDVVQFQQIYLDGRGHPPDPNPTWTGHAVGKWEGDTLVVDRAGFNDKSWLGPFPHTEKLHIIERYRRKDFGHMDVDLSIEDPDTFTTPWHIHMIWNYSPGEDLMEFVCAENNKDMLHMVGK